MKTECFTHYKKTRGLPFSTLKTWIMSIIPAAILEPDGCQESEIMRPVKQGKKRSDKLFFKVQKFVI